MPQQNTQSNNLNQYLEDIQGKLGDLITELRDDISHIENPRAEALFETSAEVLEGLKTAYKHFSEKSEEAWR